MPRRLADGDGDLRAQSAVGNASGGELGGLEDGLGACHRGGGDSEDGGGELHLGCCWGMGVWWVEEVLSLRLLCGV